MLQVNKLFHHISFLFSPQKHENEFNESMALTEIYRYIARYFDEVRFFIPPLSSLHVNLVESIFTSSNSSTTQHHAKSCDTALPLVGPLLIVPHSHSTQEVYHWRYSPASVQIRELL